MQFAIDVIIPLAALISYAVLFFVVALSKPQSSARVSFRAYLFTMAVWSLAALVIRFSAESTIFWFRMMTSGALASMLALFQFVQDVLYKKYKITPLIYLYGVISIFLVQFTPWAIPYAAINNGSLAYDFTALVYVIAGPGYLLMIFNWVTLYLAFRNSNDSTQKNRFKFLLLGISIIIIGSTVNFTDLGVYPIDITANLISAILITYAVLKHNLLDINVVIRKSLLYTVPTMILGAGYFLIINFAINIFHFYTGAQLFTLSVVVAMLTALAAQPFRDVMQNVIDRLFFRERYNSVQMLQRIGRTASSEIDVNRLTKMILEEIINTMHVSHAVLFLSPNGNHSFKLTAQIGKLLPPRTSIAPDHPIVKWLSQNDGILTNQDIDVHPSFKSMWEKEIEILNKLNANLFVPMKIAGDLIGFIALGPKKSEQFFSTEDKQILLTLSDQTGVAVQNAQLYTTAQSELIQRRETEKRLQLQLKRLSALQNINVAITTNIDLQIPLYLLLEQVTEELGVDAADVLLYDDEGEELIFVAGRGFQTDALKYTKLEVGEGLAGTAAEKKEIVHINNLQDQDTSLKESPQFKNEGFVSYFGVPLISKRKVMGVLELFHRSPLNPEKEWLNFLDTLTSETAIAVDNALLFRNLEKTNMDLAVAYETTLEGWAKTLELRDRETEGHSQRVMELTLRLAHKLGVEDDGLVHLQRGAILHDIGKMGVPDSILLKDGPLDNEEWEIMKKHPVFAHEMLSNIPFLKEAVDIPYGHHEKWDGSGYPQGLTGEEIPLSARIFAIVDVWDALRSDRPYRKAWSDKDALKYIYEESGKHFDPNVVRAFLEMIGENGRYSQG